MAPTTRNTGLTIANSPQDVSSPVEAVPAIPSPPPVVMPYQDIVDAVLQQLQNRALPSRASPAPSSIEQYLPEIGEGTNPPRGKRTLPSPPKFGGAADEVKNFVRQLQNLMEGEPKDFQSDKFQVAFTISLLEK